MHSLSWWAWAVVMLLVGLPMAVAAALATATVLALTFVASVLGRAAETRWVPALAEALKTDRREGLERL